jgi:hypothetical protein
MMKEGFGMRGIRTVCVTSLFGLLATACTLIPTKADLKVDPDLQWNTSPTRVTAYLFLGMPRDCLDLPFTVLHRFLYYKTRGYSSFLGLKMANPSDGPTGEVFVGVVGASLMGSIPMIQEGISWKTWFVDGWEYIGIGLCGVAVALVYPITGAPLEDVLFRYPHDPVTFGMGYRAISEANYEYFPNIEIFLKERRPTRPQ